MRGFSLLGVLLLISCGLLGIASLVELVYFFSASGVSITKEWQALYYAEAGIEKAKTIFAAYPSLYTDISPPSAVGFSEKLGQGGFKFIKYQGQNQITSIGYVGADLSQAKARITITVSFQSGPFKVTKWERN